MLRRRRTTARNRTIAVIVSLAVLGLAGGAVVAAATGARAPAGDTSPRPRVTATAPLADPSVTVPSSPAAPRPEADAGRNDDGYRHASLGVPEPVVGADGAVVFEVDVTDIEVDAQCTAADSPGSANGHFLSVSVTISPSADQPAGAIIPVSPADFVVVGPDGNALTMTAGNGQLCVDTASALPALVTGTTSVQGLVVLDVPVDSGWVRYLPGGFEWPI